MLSQSIKRNLLTSARPTTTRLVQPRLYSQGYGDGKGDPKGEKPQDQGANPSADKEHPGAPPPKEGHGSGSSPTKGTAEGHNTGSATQSQGQKRQFSTLRKLQFSEGRSLWAKEQKPKSTEGLKPKILSESPPAGDEQPEDVRKHNEEMEKRNDKASQSVANDDTEKDKVGEKFWSGEGKGRKEEANKKK